MDLITGALQGVFRWVIYTSLMTSLLIGIVLVVRLAFKERLGAKWQYALWILVILRLVLPWFPSTSFSLYNVIPVQPNSTIMAPVPVAASDTPQLGDTTVSPVGAADQPMGATPISQPANLHMDLNLVINAASWLWLVGIILIGVRHWRANRRFARRVAKGVAVANPQTIELFNLCRQEMAVASQVALVETPAVKSPALFGLLNPVLVIPPYLHETLGSSQLRYTLLHEMAHLKRKDILVSWVMNLLAICHWFNPLIAYSFTCLREDQELACDSSVLTVVKAEDPKEYAHTIISMLEHFAASPQLPTLAGITSKKSQIKRRLTMINLFRGRSWAWSALGVVVVVTLALVALTNGKTQASADPAANTSLPPVTTPAPSTTPVNSIPSQQPASTLTMNIGQAAGHQTQISSGQSLDVTASNDGVPLLITLPGKIMSRMEIGTDVNGWTVAMRNRPTADTFFVYLLLDPSVNSSGTIKITQIYDQDNKPMLAAPFTFNLKVAANPTAEQGPSTSPTGSSSILYTNTQYGFTFTLPSDWKGYSILNTQWQGLSIGGQSGESVVATGPMISIRDPRWTAQTPRQDIPIMVFTLDQWKALQNDQFHIGAAPIRPSELGRNSAYVFALPARYNYAFPAGYQEVEQILANKPLQAK